MTEADILASTYTDTCTVYRPYKVVQPSGESVFKKGLEGQAVYEGILCALSSPAGGKLNQGRATASVDTDFSLFVRPEVDIQPGDTVVAVRLGKRFVCGAGLPERHPSHNNVPLKLQKDKA